MKKIEDTVSWLNSQEAADMLLADPYWPKWHSPWWRMHLLMELGQLHLIPKSFASRFFDQFQKHYLPTFPSRLQDIPAGIDPLMQIVCHCALGSAVQMLTPILHDGKPLLSWFGTWAKTYLLSDGGYNCDEAVYNKDNPSSSLVSTLPMLEALLLEVKLFHPSDHLPILQRGVQYFLNRGLTGSSKQPNRPILEIWDQPAFPRFYEFDGQRLLKFLVDYHLTLSVPLPDILQEYCYRLETQIYTLPMQDRPFRTVFLNEFSRVQNESGTFVPGHSQTFPALESFTDPAMTWPYLEKEFQSIKQSLQSGRPI